jgi:hypothetical protein
MGAQQLNFLAAPGELGRLIRAFDWAATPLGPLQDWPQSLRTGQPDPACAPSDVDRLGRTGHLPVQRRLYKPPAAHVLAALLDRLARERQGRVVQVQV